MAIDRYHRQTLLPQIGQAGQKKLADSRVLLVGCGALGSTIAEQLARAGVGNLRIADRDIVELTNLQRQVLFDENDAHQGLPKAIAAVRRLSKINSTITLDPRIVDVDADNVEELVDGVQIILDGTDNVSTRYLVNDVSVKLGIPWIYGACVGTEGRLMTIRPNVDPCLRCVFPQPPDPGELATCDTAGVLGAAASVIGSLQSLAAIKLLTGNEAALPEEMLTVDLWTNYFRIVSTVGAKRADCPTCGLRRFEFLESRDQDRTTKLCGRNSIQVHAAASNISLSDVAQRLSAIGSVQLTPFMVRCILSETELTMTVFADGRVIVHGTNDPGRARAVVARFIGS